MPEKTVLIDEEGNYDATPTYLFDHADLYKTNPIEAGITWFAEAHYGLQVNYGLHSLIGGGYELMDKKQIPVDSYINLKDNFKADKFDAIDIVEFAIANGMRYLDFRVCGPDGFCLWNTQTTDFNCAKSPANRDLLGEIASVCEYHGVGLCLTYSHGRNWHHNAAPESKVKGDEKAELQAYIEFVEAQVKELLTQYGPVAAICFDGIDSARAHGPEKLCCEDLFKMIRFLQPQVLVSYQQGFTGNEDFFSVVGKLPGEDADKLEQGFVNSQLEKPLQLIDSMTPGVFGYDPEFAGKHIKRDAVWEKLKKAGEEAVNLLINTSLLPDGSLDLEDINILLDVGRKVESHGFPSMRN